MARVGDDGGDAVGGVDDVDGGGDGGEAVAGGDVVGDGAAGWLWGRVWWGR
jgi:hypothetical protein